VKAQYVVVTHPGTDEEALVSHHATVEEAYAAMRQWQACTDDSVDVAKRTPDGRITYEL
jgi:hypothetical protein